MKRKDLILFPILFLWAGAFHRQYSSASSNEIDPEDENGRTNVSEPSAGHPRDLQTRQRQSKIKIREALEDETTEATPAPKKMSEREIIEKILRKNDYDWRVRPVGLNSTYSDTGGPVKVTVNIYLRSISKIDDVNMEYSAQFTFRESWIDRRLAYERMANVNATVPNFIVLSEANQQIWMPDTFFQNEKEARKHMIDKPNVLIRIYPSGEILYSVRLSMVLSCPMSLEYYPLDEQRCLIELASYAYTTDDIEYQWKNETPVQQKDGLGKSLPSFELQAVRTGYCTSTTNTGQYSCLRTELILRREFSYYLLQLYIPSFMLVIVSWVSFWLDKDSVPARVTLGVTTLLTMTTQSSGINAKLPPVSYTKAIDVWIGVCLAFIFGALLEFALVNYAARKDIMRNVGSAIRRGRRPGVSAPSVPPITSPSLDSLTVAETQAQQHADEQHNYNTFMMNPTKSPPMLRHQQDILPQPSTSPYVTRSSQQPPPPYQFQSLPTTSPQLQTRANGRLPNQSQPSQAQRGARHNQRSCMDLWLSKYKERSKRIDVVSRLVFPVGFFIFNCVYWTVYML